MTEKTVAKESFVGLSSRDAYGKVIVELADQHEEIVGLSADLSGSVKLSDFREKYPGRFINVGIACRRRRRGQQGRLRRQQDEACHQC